MKFRKKPVVVEAVRWVSYFDVMPVKPLVGIHMLRIGLGLPAHVDDNNPMLPSWMRSAVTNGIAEVLLNAHPSDSRGAYSVSLRLRTADGWFDVSAGDLIVKDGATIYAVKPDLFDASYEPDQGSKGEEADEGVYFTLRQINGSNCTREEAVSLKQAQVRARRDVEQGRSPPVSVCREISSYARKYSVVEEKPRNRDPNAEINN